jgi:hypothetical protein
MEGGRRQVQGWTAISCDGRRGESGETRDVTFQDLLVECRRNTSTVNLRVSPPQIERLKKLYFDASVRDLQDRGKRSADR